jgi:hypothetical protein
MPTTRLLIAAILFAAGAAVHAQPAEAQSRVGIQLAAPPDSASVDSVAALAEAPGDSVAADSLATPAAAVLDSIGTGEALVAVTDSVVTPEILVAPPGADVSGAQTNLRAALRGAEPGTIIRFAAGTYDIEPDPYVEATCGNCESESTLVQATVGLIVRGSALRLVGPEEGEAIIRTHAGYGILFEECHNCTLERLTVTAGERDTSASATDAAVVVKSGSVTIEGCTLRDNIGDSTTVAKTVVGIAGVAGRDGGVLTIRNNRIVRNSWDGIALYRNAQAVIEGNWIDGVDVARGTRVGGGRGVGIGATWNAYATVRGNVVRRYWKGIGVFVDAQVTAEENVIEHIATWGVSLWDAGHGRPSGFFQRNVIFDTGACGASIVRTSDLPPAPGRFVQNIVMKTGQDPRYDSGEPYCYQMPIAKHAAPQIFSIGGNVLGQNRLGADLPSNDDLEESVFRQRAQPIWDQLARWRVLRETDFWKEVVMKK